MYSSFSLYSFTKRFCFCREIAVRNDALVHPLIANILSNELFSPRESRNQFNMQNLSALFQSSNQLGSSTSSREEHSARVSATLALVFSDFLLEGADSTPAAPSSAEQVAGESEMTPQQQPQQMSENHAPALRERLHELHRLLRCETGGGSRGGAFSSSSSSSAAVTAPVPVPVPALDLVSFALALMHPRLEGRDAFSRCCRPLCARLNSLDELLDPTLSGALEHKFSAASPAYKKRFVESVVELVTLSQLYSVTPQVNEMLSSNGEYNRTNTRTQLRTFSSLYCSYCPFFRVLVFSGVCIIKLSAYSRG